MRLVPKRLHPSVCVLTLRKCFFIFLVWDSTLLGARLLALGSDVQLPTLQGQTTLQSGPPSSNNNELTIPTAIQPPKVPRTEAVVTDPALSHDVTQYLHRNQLPLVTAQVQRDKANNVKTLVFSGQVKSLFGKEDAELKARDFIGRNTIMVHSCSPQPCPTVFWTRETYEICFQRSSG